MDAPKDAWDRIIMQPGDGHGAWECNNYECTQHPESLYTAPKPSDRKLLEQVLALNPAKRIDALSFLAGYAPEATRAALTEMHRQEQEQAARRSADVATFTRAWENHKNQPTPEPWLDTMGMEGSDNADPEKCPECSMDWGTHRPGCPNDNTVSER